ncbi:hypothetical protein TNCV_1305431 [Trichonephila clavipes]|nr:hypothetical protein TNCV_1305431 [Trichonephila clavipes]
MPHSSTSEMQQQVTATGIVRSSGCVSHSADDTDGRKIVGRVQLDPVCCDVSGTKEDPRREIFHCGHRSLIHKWVQVAPGE